MNFLSSVVIVCAGHFGLIVKQTVIHHLEAFGQDIFTIFVHFYDSVILSNVKLFLINPAIQVSIMKQEDNKLLIKLNHFFPGGASDNNIKQRFFFNVLVIILEDQFERIMTFFFFLEEVKIVEIKGVHHVLSIF